MIQGRRGQALAELTVFGSILVFIIGSILQQGYSAATYQQAQLESQRLALLKSYTGGPKFNLASFMIVEDKLSVGFNKYGMVDREPSITAGNGSLSTDLMFPPDWDPDLKDPANNTIPVLLMKVNGQWFNIQMSAAYNLYIFRTNTEMVTDPLLPGSYPAVRLYAMSSAESTGCNVADVLSTTMPAESNGDTGCGQFFRIHNPKAELRLAREIAEDCEAAIDCNWRVKTQAVAGSANIPSVMSATDIQKAYDYNRNGIFTDDLWNIYDPSPSQMPGAMPATHPAWMWVAKPLFPGGTRPLVACVPVASGAASTGACQEVNPTDGAYPSYDVDGDMMEEVIFKVDPEQMSSNGNSAVYHLQVMDQNAGDMDTSEASMVEDPADMGGLKQDVHVFTRLNDGTVLEIRDGGAFLPDAKEPYSMSVTQKKQFDVISRVYQLNRRMAVPFDFVRRNPGVLEVVCGAQNPAVLPRAGSSGCCMTTDHVLSTCYDMGQRTLYIRSRLSDERGHKWITGASPQEKNMIQTLNK